MKNAGKRFLSLLVCMCMIFTFIPDIALTVDAASSGTVSGWTNENIGLSYVSTANDDSWTYN